ncbi:hypothetical protein LR48_Vigan03g151300 [Vigna angularis]|uniref:Uncharacterized protein n=1 Tax=Phaseolus angularis TaxID=3914 RepID=A0A0L9U5T2_PHAAN|nr:hypothetical protein LR48_Vigan03g151300 [Vigna angularis]
MQFERMEPWEGLDIDDSDLKAFLKKCNSTATLIPGPAGNVQAAMLNRQTDEPKSTQEFVNDIATTTFDRDFKSNPWIWAEKFIKHHGLVQDGNINNVTQLERLNASSSHCPSPIFFFCRELQPAPWRPEQQIQNLQPLQEKRSQSTIQKPRVCVAPLDLLMCEYWTVNTSQAKNATSLHVGSVPCRCSKNTPKPSMLFQTRDGEVLLPAVISLGCCLLFAKWWLPSDVLDKVNLHLLWVVMCCQVNDRDFSKTSSCIVKECNPNGLGDMKIVVKVGALSPFGRIYYLNITVRNVVKVFKADIGPPTEELLNASSRPVIRPNPCAEHNNKDKDVGPSEKAGPSRSNNKTTTTMED